MTYSAKINNAKALYENGLTTQAECEAQIATINKEENNKQDFEALTQNASMTYKEAKTFLIHKMEQSIINNEAFINTLNILDTIKNDGTWNKKARYANIVMA